MRLPVRITTSTAADTGTGSQITSARAAATATAATTSTSVAKVPIGTEAIRRGEKVIPQGSTRVLEACVGLGRHRERPGGYLENILTSWCRVGELEVRRRYRITAASTVRAEALRGRWLLLLAQAGPAAQPAAVGTTAVHEEGLLLVRVRRLVSVYRRGKKPIPGVVERGHEAALRLGEVEVVLLR